MNIKKMNKNRSDYFRQRIEEILVRFLIIQNLQQKKTELSFQIQTYMATKPQKLVSPKALEKLGKYVVIREKLLNYFFRKEALTVNNKQAMEAYSQVYLLMTSLQDKMQDHHKYESYDLTYLRQYRLDLKNFCQSAKDIIKKSQNLQSFDYIAYVLQWVNNYTRFMHWTYKTFMAIQKYSLHVKGTTLYFEGLTILKTHLIQGIYEELIQAVINCLQLHKDNQLPSTSELMEIITLIGTVGLRKYTYVRLQKWDERFVFLSRYGSKQSKDNQQQFESPFQTQYFKKNFINPLIKHLKDKYTLIANDLIKLSTPQYVQKALNFLKIQQKTADIFYPKDKVKSLVIRSLQEILSHEKAEQLIRKPNTGLFSMLERSQLGEAKNLLQLIKRSSNFKLFTKEYQRFIQIKGNQILDKVSPQDQKNAKKQSVTQMIDQLYQLYQLMEKTTSEVANNDTQIISAQTYGFQLICNKGDNKVCNFLAYYADNMLRKQEDSLNQMSDLTIKIGKISKYLYSWDAFIKLYQKLLGFRMLFDNFRKKETELGIINLLKNEAGLSSLNKISCMVSDYIFSQNFNNEKASKLKQEVGFTLQVMILTSGSWQIQDSKSGRNSVPLELIPAVQSFQKAYLQQLPDRTITWVFNYGRAIVLAHFDNNVKHVLIINNYQLCILLYLQRKGFKGVKIGDLVQELKVEDELAFNASIMMLLKSKVILKQGNASKIESKNEMISFNNAFKSQSLKVRCFNLPRYIQKGSGHSGELVLERSHLIDAAIVKLMKSRRIVQYQQLIPEVQKMCKTFKAQIGMIKKRIQNCIQREFLQRDPEDMNTLLYKP